MRATPACLRLEPTGDPGWLLVEHGVDRAREREIEAIFTVANGYIGTRGSLEEGSTFSSPATFAAGVYVADPESALGPRLAVLPDWAHLEIVVDGRQVSLEAGRVLEHRRMLDLRQGVLWREWRQEDPSGRITRVTFLRLAGLADRHVLVQSVTVTAENYAGRLRFVARVGAGGASGTHGTLVETRTGHVVRVNGTTVGFATTFAFRQPPEAGPSTHEGRSSTGEESWSWEAGLGETAHLDRTVVVFTSRDVADPTGTAAQHLATIRPLDIQGVVQAHVEAWRRRWQSAEVRVVGDEPAQRALRFAVYHLVAATNPGDEHASIGARGLTGEAYRGHVFWDTEIYMLPFYVHTDPPAARALLMYRYHTLSGARRKARAQGYRGALYAWESADTGDETTPRMTITPAGRVVAILTGEREHHISADVAYAVWQYWRATGDDDFMVVAGADILVETARFWASRAHTEGDGRAHIRGVIGPDEYHEMVDDNAYTNVMARWNLDRAADTAAILKRERGPDWQQLAARLGVTEQEPEDWRRVAASLVTGFDPESGLFEQFAGYFALEEVDVAAHRRCAMPIDVCLGPERMRRSKPIKQADVVMLSALLWDEWPRAVHEVNFRYYEPRTAHGSSLSPAIHALVAARLGEDAVARRYVRQAGEIDLADTMGNAAGGVHMAALGGLWQAAVLGVAGLRAGEHGIVLDPHLLAGWAEVCVPIRWRGCALGLRLVADPGRVEVDVTGDGELTVGVVDGPGCRARPGRRYALGRHGAGWGTWQEADG
jgi:kojibiose phosphorylase